jgi:hypothetical protein
LNRQSVPAISRSRSRLAANLASGFSRGTWRGFAVRILAAIALLEERLQRGCRPFVPSVNPLLTITSQHPDYKESPGLLPEGAADCSSGGEPRESQGSQGLQGVTPCRCLMHDPKQICFPSSSWPLLVLLAWACRLRPRSSGSVPDRCRRFAPFGLAKHATDNRLRDDLSAVTRRAKRKRST